MIGTLTGFGRILFTIAAVAASAVAWEFAEWVTDRLGWTHAQLTLGDTLFDMLLGLIGGGAFLTFMWLVRRSQFARTQGSK